MAKTLYHCLEGVLRDIANAQKHEQEGDTLASAVMCRLRDAWEDLRDDVEGPDEVRPADELDGTADDAESDDRPQDELASVQLTFRPGNGGAAAGPAERSHAVSGGVLLDRAVDGLAGSEREQALAELDALRRDALAATEFVTGRTVLRGRKKATPDGT